MADQYWSKIRFNIGVATGSRSAGLVVLDWDLGRPDPTEFPPTFTVRSRKGVHLYYRDPIPRSGVGRWRNTETEQVDIRAEGGLVVAPGSCIDGFCYEVEADLPIAALPNVGIPEHHSRRASTMAVADYEGVDSPVLVLAAEAILGAMEGAEEGGRNSRLFGLACSLSELVASGKLNPSWLKALTQAGVQAGLDRGEAGRAVNSAWRTVTKGCSSGR